MSVFNDIKKAFRRIGRVEGDMKRAFSDIQKFGGQIESVGKDAGRALAKLETVDDEFKKVWQQIEDLPETIEDAIDDALEEALQEASQEAAKQVLENAADTIELLAPDTFTMTFGIELALVIQGEVGVSCTIPNPVAKLTEIRHWADNPPKGRAQIIECIKDFGPESLSAEFKVSGNGLGATWNGDDKYDKIDAFLEKRGVK